MHTIYFLEQMHALKLDQMHTMLLEQMNDLCLEQMLGSRLDVVAAPIYWDLTASQSESWGSFF